MGLLVRTATNQRHVRGHFFNITFLKIVCITQKFVILIILYYGLANP